MKNIVLNMLLGIVAIGISAGLIFFAFVLWSVATNKFTEKMKIKTYAGLLVAGLMFWALGFYLRIYLA